jgi:hypothetical protein
VRDLEVRPSSVLQEFLTASFFVGKGTEIDCWKLAHRYGPGFEIELEDVEATRLKPHGLSVHFADMVAQFVGEPSAPFKRKEVSVSDWRVDVLTSEQVLYAAFDVVSLFLAYPKFPGQTPFLPQECPFHLLQNADLIGDDSEMLIAPPSMFSFRSALVAFFQHERRPVSNTHCALCKEDIENRDAHIWNRHSDALFQLFNWRPDLPLAIADITVMASGRLQLGPRKEFPSFTAYYMAWRAERGARAVPAARPVSCQVLLAEYLEKTRRITVKECRICQEAFDNMLEHVWERHSDMLVEWLPSGSIPLARMNGDPEAVSHAWHFLHRLKLYRLIGQVCECTLCGWRFLGPVSLVCHAIMKHCRIRVANGDVTRARRSRDLARDLCACASVFPAGWDVGIDNCCSWIAQIDELPFGCRDCRLEFPDLYSLRVHVLRKHLVIELGGTEPETPSGPISPPHTREVRPRTTNLYVRGFDASMTDDGLVAHFSQFGTLRSVKVQRDPETGASKLFGFVVFDRIEDARRCIRESVLLKFDGRPAYVTEKVTQAERQRDDPTQHNDPLDALRRKVSEVQPPSLQTRLLTIVKRISDQQAAALLADDELFELWIQSA